MPETFVRQLPMRWADLDSLNHVNNVVYLDYAAEARAMLEYEGVLDAGLPIARMKVEFLRPLLLSRTPVSVTTTRVGDEIVQEICIDRDDKRVVFCRVTSTVGQPVSLSKSAGAIDPKPSRLRRSDLDRSGLVTDTKMFELFQEGRIMRLAEILDGKFPGRFVVAMVEVTFGAVLHWRPEPYETRTWISRVGNSSFTAEAEITDGDTVYAHATSVLVGFDLPNQKSRKLNDDEVVSLTADQLS